jgi:Phosphoenolpyruvate phosphomutase
LFQAREFVAAPGVFDLVSAKIANLTNAKALYMTGFGTVASYLGYPDAGLATYTDMLDRAAAIAQANRGRRHRLWRPSQRPSHGAWLGKSWCRNDPARGSADPQKNAATRQTAASSPPKRW